MNHIRLLLLAALALLLTLEVSAAAVDATAARAVAQGFLQSQPSGMLKAASHRTLVLAHTEASASRADVADYYVFNTDDGSAFVIVSGDDLTEPVLAYGDGAIDVSRLPSNVRWWLGEYKRQIEYLRTLSPAQLTKAAKCSPHQDLTIEPMITSKWNQGKPYNNQCAEYEGERCVTGCVATAMAMVMHYWKYPAVLPALPAYTTATFHIPVEALPSATLDWDNMLDVYPSRYTDEQGAAVATLMRYCSQACFMDCSPEGSGSSGLEQLLAFKLFGYNRAARHLYRDNYSAQEWDEMVVNDLSAGHPIAYCGRGDQGGHAFVLDGCADGKYHFNWGWGGSYDGYFELDLLVPYKGCDFSYEQDMNYQICPDDGSGAELEAAYDFEVDGIYYTADGDEATVTYRDIALDCYSGDVVIPEQVTHDGVTYRVTGIGENAFAGCRSLTSVSIPRVERIGDYAFALAPNLRTLTMSGGVKSLGTWAFYGLNCLQRLEVIDLDSFAAIGYSYLSSSPLSYCRRLYHDGELVTDLVIHAGAGCIGNYAFASCEDIKSVTIEDGVCSIGDYAFYDCHDLERVEIGAVDSIGLCSFLYTDKLREITLHEGLKGVGPSAFYGCSALKSLDFPSTLRTIKYAAFAYCDGVEHVRFNGGDVEMEEAAFYDCRSLTDVVLSPTQRTVGSAAFAYCTALNHLDLGQRLDSIAEYAFYNCSSLEEVTIPATVTVIGENAFAASAGLSLVHIPDLKAWCDIKFMSEAANPLLMARRFAVGGGEPVKDLVLPEGLQSVGANAFMGCTALESVSFPASMRTIGASAFKLCTGLSRVEAPSLEQWCAIGFENESANPLCEAHHLTLGGEELTSLVLPQSVTVIGNYAFSNCFGLTDVEMGDHVRAIGNYAFARCDSLTRVVMGDGVQSIGDFAFNHCGQLASIETGEGLKSIGDRAFASCNSLQRVALGSHVEQIASKAFSQSMSILDITCKSAEPPVLAAKDCFPLIVYTKAQVTVPMASLEEYRTADFWKQFKNMQGAILSPVLGDVNADGEVTVADVNATIEQCYATSPDMLADVNGDGEVSIADVNAVIDIVLGGK